MHFPASASIVARQTAPSCAVPCLNDANFGSCSKQDYTCLCNSQPFVTSVTNCVESSCSGSDLANAETAAEAICSAVGVTLTIAATSASQGSSSSALTRTSTITSNGAPITTVYNSAGNGGQATATSSSTKASSPTLSAILGGVIGGVAGLGVVVVVLFWLLRRRNNVDDSHRNFHPGHVVGHSSGGGTLPQNYLGIQGTPFQYGAPGPWESPHQGGGMTQYGHSPYPGAMATSHRSMSPPSHYPNLPSNNPLFNQPPPSGPGPGSYTSGTYYGPSSGGGDFSPGRSGMMGLATPHAPNNPMYNYQPQSGPETGSDASGSYYGQSSGGGGNHPPGMMWLPTQHEESSGAIGQSSGEGEKVHSDGGRVNQEGLERLGGLPPAYDSIPADEGG